jgi:acetyl esterase/lipase
MVAHRGAAFQAAMTAFERACLWVRTKDTPARQPPQGDSRYAHIDMRCSLFFLIAALSAAAELPIPADVIVERGVDYTSIPHGKLAMDIVRPKAPGKYPGVVLIHGGGFSGGKRDSYLPMAVRLAQNGYCRRAVSYRLTPMFQFPLPLHDVKAAVRFLRANAGKFSVDKEHMAAIGASAWRDLVAVSRRHAQHAAVRRQRGASGGIEQRRLRHQLLRRSDMRRAYEGSRNAAEALPRCLGGDRMNAIEAALPRQPAHWISPDSAPILAIHGTRDRNVPFEQSVWLVERYARHGRRSGARNGRRRHAWLETAPGKTERAFARSIDFLNRKLKPNCSRRAGLMVTEPRPRRGDSGYCLAVRPGVMAQAEPSRTEVSALPNGHVLYVEDPKGLRDRDRCRAESGLAVQDHQRELDERATAGEWEHVAG